MSSVVFMAFTLPQVLFLDVPASSSASNQPSTSCDSLSSLSSISSKSLSSNMASSNITGCSDFTKFLLFCGDVLFIYYTYSFSFS